MLSQLYPWVVVCLAGAGPLCWRGGVILRCWLAVAGAGRAPRLPPQRAAAEAGRLRPHAGSQLHRGGGASLGSLIVDTVVILSWIEWCDRCIIVWLLLSCQMVEVIQQTGVQDVEIACVNSPDSLVLVRAMQHPAGAPQTTSPCQAVWLTSTSRPPWSSSTLPARLLQTTTTTKTSWLAFLSLPLLVLAYRRALPRAWRW